MKKFLLIFSSIIITSLFVEICLHLTLPWTNIPWGPGVKRWKNAHFQFNSWGYRDREWNLKKPAGTTRVIVLGDSFVEGATEDPEDGLVVKLEQQLQQVTPSAIEVLNLGKSGANTKDAISILKTDGLALDPDLVILVYLPNDAEPRGYIEQQYYSNRRTTLQTRSFIFYLLDTRLGQLFAALNLYDPPLISQVRTLYAGETLTHHQENLRSFIQTAHDDNIPLLIVHFPFLFRLENYPFTDIADSVAAIAKETNTAFLDLTSIFTNYSTDDLVIGWWDGHPNATANRIVAEEIASAIMAW